MSIPGLAALSQTADGIINRQLGVFNLSAAELGQRTNAIDTATLTDAGNAARARVGQELIEHIVSGCDTNRADTMRHDLTRLEGLIKQEHPTPFGTLPDVAPDARPTRMRQALAASFGTLTGWLLFSPTWAIGPNALGEARVLADLLSPIVSAGGAALGILYLTVPIPFKNSLEFFQHLHRRLGRFLSAIAAFERQQ